MPPRDLSEDERDKPIHFPGPKRIYTNSPVQGIASTPSPLCSSLYQPVTSDPTKIIFSSSPRSKKSSDRSTPSASEGIVRDFINWAKSSTLQTSKDLSDTETNPFTAPESKSQTVYSYRPMKTSLSETSSITSGDESDEHEFSPINDRDHDLNDHSPKTITSSTPNSSMPMIKENQKKSSFLDILNFSLLAFLYMFQGIPFGLAFGTIPFLLKSASHSYGATYTEIGIFSFASYPYTFKLLWSPLVDSLFFKRFGRRKSWIVPMQFCIGIVFLWMGKHIETFIFKNPPEIYPLTISFILLIIFCATQDIAVDGWALTILSKNNIRYGSLAQTIGLNSGYFLSFTIFLAFNSAEFCNKYLSFMYSNTSVHLTGIVSLGEFLSFCGYICLLLTMLVIFKREESTHDKSSIHDSKLSSAYMNIIRIFQLPWMPTFVMILLVHKFGYMANEILTPLKLIEKGFRKEDLAIIALLDFPIQILFGWLTIKWSKGSRPMLPWLYATYIRIIMTGAGMIVVANFPSDGQISWGYFLIVLAITMVTSLMSTMMFVSQGAFFNVISDPIVGGTFITVSNYTYRNTRFIL